MKPLLLILIGALTLPVSAKENPGSKSTSPSVLVTASNCTPSTSQTDLNINNVRARLLVSADMWWDLTNPGYEVPVGTGKHSLYAGSLWIGGIDAGGQIKVAAQTYRQTGLDFWPGAVDTTTVSITPGQCLFYDRFWKVNRPEIDDFVNNGTTTPDIISWPGNGDPLFNEGHFLAPFVDVNGDGIYDYTAGDYPGYNLNATYPTYPGLPIEVCNNYLFGDQSIFWVINDVGNVHTETGSPSIGLEIRCQAFAFQSNLPSLNNSTFYKYQLINRSTLTLEEVYFGQWVDPDLGNAVDDYVGCDVGRGFGYCYNGDADDDGASGYGIDPPAIGVDFLQGPYADFNDLVDNDRDGCVDCTFIDSSGTTIVVADINFPETIIMSKFMYYNNVNNSPVGNPNGGLDFYYYLQGIWLDGQPMTYGGDGRDPSNPVCNFMFPGTTDPSFPATNWTETSAGNVPEDRRFIQSAGQFTLEPGEVNYITTSVVWARETGGGPLGSVALLQQYDDEVQQLFSQCFRVMGVGIEENPDAMNVSVYPNPSRDYVIFEGIDPGNSYELKIFNTAGKLIHERQVKSGGKYQWDTGDISKGTYIYEIKRNKNSSTGKVVIY